MGRLPTTECTYLPTYLAERKFNAERECNRDVL